MPQSSRNARGNAMAPPDPVLGDAADPVVHHQQDAQPLEGREVADLDEVVVAEVDALIGVHGPTEIPRRRVQATWPRPDGEWTEEADSLATSTRTVQQDSDTN